MRATSDTTSARWARERRRAPPRPACASGDWTSARAARTAGTSPTSIPQTRDTARVKAKVRVSIRGSLSVGSADGSRLSDRGRSDQRDDDAAKTAQASEHGAFDQQLSDEPAMAGAERRANGELVHATRPAREQQVGDIGAHDEQDEPDRAEQRQQCLLPAAQKILSERDNVDANAGVVAGVCRCQVPRDRIHLSARLCHGHAGRKAGDSESPVVDAAVVEQRIVNLPDRNVDVVQERAVAQQAGALGYHADDGMVAAVEGQVAAEDGRVGGEATLPGRLAENGDARGAPLVFVRPEGATEQRLDTECRKEVCRGHRAQEAFGEAAAGERQDAATERSQLLERANLCPPIQVVQVRNRVAVAVLVRPVHHDQAVGVRQGHRIEEGGVKHAERRRRGTDAQREGEYSGEREARSAE